MDPQTLIARRISKELREGMLVNLGIESRRLSHTMYLGISRFHSSRRTG